MSDWQFRKYAIAGCLAMAVALPVAAKAGDDDALRQTLQKWATEYGLPYDGRPVQYEEKLPDGSRFLIINWEAGTRKNIVKLRIPMGYAAAEHFSPWSGGRASGPSPRTYLVAEEFAFEGLFQSGQIQPADSTRVARNQVMSRELTASDDRRTIYGHIETAFIPVGDFQEAFAISRKTRLEFLISSPMLFGPSASPAQMKEFSLHEKSGLAGLRRLGIDPIERYMALCENRCEPKDFYFAGDKPESAPVYITCTADIIREHKGEAERKAIPQCQHVFLFEPLNATVMLTYRRDLLGSWREIQRGSEQLLLSFLGRDK